MTKHLLSYFLACVAVAFTLPTAVAQPNIIVVLVDDLNVEVLTRVPQFKQLMTYRGMTFERSMVPLSSCCPSRVATLTGKHAHQTGVFSNGPPAGGWLLFNSSGAEAAALPTWGLVKRGYRNVYVGKYLNGYSLEDASGLPRVKPPGWHDWHVARLPDSYLNYNYDMLHNGAIYHYGSADADYGTDVIAAYAGWFIRRWADIKPLFMVVATTAPHEPATPPRRYLNSEAGLKAPRSPGFGEKPSPPPTWMEFLPPISSSGLQALDHLYRRQVESMKAVVDLLQTIITAVTETGQLENTIIVFTSDNGYHHGLHGLDYGKLTYFDSDILVPLVIRGPGIPLNSRAAELVANIDLAPTVADYAGVAVPSDVAGRSLRPILENTLTGRWRNNQLLEAYVGNVGSARQGVVAAPSYIGIRTSNMTYIFYDSGEEEVYDIVADPEQRYNIAAQKRADDSVMMNAMKSFAIALSQCSGAECRTLEELGGPEILNQFGQP